MRPEKVRLTLVSRTAEKRSITLNWPVSLTAAELIACAERRVGLKYGDKRWQVVGFHAA